MENIKECLVASGQHFWVRLDRERGLQSYSCPMCGQLVYWSDITLSWVKPSTSGGEKIKGNLPRGNN